MKLLNILSIAAFGTLIAAGCSASSVTTTDGGTDGSTATDTGTKTDSGTTDSAKTDTNVGETPDPEKVCNDCVMSKCGTELTACGADMTTQKACQDLITCLVSCTTAACQDACISDSMSQPAKDLVQCIYIDKCKMECTSGG